MSQVPIEQTFLIMACVGIPILLVCTNIIFSNADKRIEAIKKEYSDMVKVKQQRNADLGKLSELDKLDRR